MRAPWLIRRCLGPLVRGTNHRPFVHRDKAKPDAITCQIEMKTNLKTGLKNKILSDH